MKVEFRRSAEVEGIKLLILARERTAEVEALIERLSVPERIPAYDARGEVLLAPEEIVRIYTQQRRVLVDSARGSFSLRLRLYEIEEMLDGAEFVRISNSEIVRRSCIQRLDFSLAGTIRLTLRSGLETYVSRRYVSRIRKLFEG